MVTIGRRELLTALGMGVAGSFAAHAQLPQRMRRIGVLMGLVDNDQEAQSRVAAFEHGLTREARTPAPDWNAGLGIPSRSRDVLWPRFGMIARSSS
jgi:hypothetical protein